MNLESSRYQFNSFSVVIHRQTNELVFEAPGCDPRALVVSTSDWPALRDFIDRALALHAVPQPEPPPVSQPNSELKPFNREAALAGVPVRTRDGRQVIAVTQDPDKEPTAPYPLLAWIEGDECLHTFTDEGMFYSDGEETQDDLFME